MYRRPDQGKTQQIIYCMQNWGNRLNKLHTDGIKNISQLFSKFCCLYNIMVDTHRLSDKEKISINQRNNFTLTNIFGKRMNLPLFSPRFPPSQCF